MARQVRGTRWVVGVGLILLLLAAGCGQAAAPQPASEPAPTAAQSQAQPTAHTEHEQATCTPEGQLNAILWEGYATEESIAAFKEATGVDVNVTFIASNDEVFAKIRSKTGQFDLVPATTDISQQYIEQGLVQPLNLAEIPNSGHLFDSFKNLPQATQDGKTYGVAHTWSADPIIYNADHIADPEASYKALFDETYKGKVALYDDLGSLWVGALVLGYDPFELSKEQMAEVVKVMREQRELVRTYWSTGDDLVKLMASGEVWIATGWNYMYTQLKEEGVNVQRLEPKEGNLGWVDVLMIPVNAQHPCAAHKWINWAISDKGGSSTALASGYSISSPEINQHLTEDQVRDLHMDDPSFVNKIVLWERVDRPMYQDAWNEVKR